MGEAKTVIQLLSEASAAIGAVEKKERNDTGKGFNFRGIDTVVNAVSPEFRERGIVVIPNVVDRVYEQIEVGSNRTLMGHVMLRTEFTFHGPTDAVLSTVDSEAFDSGDKAVAKAMSIGLRTALLQVLMLPTDEPDPDATSYERASKVADPTKAELGRLVALAKVNGTNDAMKAWFTDHGVPATVTGFKALTQDALADLHAVVAPPQEGVCPTCNGMGEVEGQPCTWCEGSGRA